MWKNQHKKFPVKKNGGEESECYQILIHFIVDKAVFAGA